ncbi:MAG TPA: hypothetical protein VHY75_14550 [Steroidobacteraceae bacterium]|nr:hypothetical protein [Steroidobacteraceae bacterium]
MKHKRRVLNIVGAIVVVAVFTPTLLTAIWRVSQGRGSEVYQNVYGLQIHWISVIVFVLSIVCARCMALIARAIYKLRERHDETTLRRQVAARRDRAS